MDTDIDSELDLDGALRQLADGMTHYPGSEQHILADHMLYGMALDVRAHAEAVALLSTSEWWRAAWANTRAAFESAADLELLVAAAGDYDYRAAQMLVYEIYERANLADRTVHSGRVGNEFRDPEDRVRQEAAKLDGLGAGQGATLRRAHEAFDKLDRYRRLQRHWSGMSRKEVYQAGSAPTGHNTTEMTAMRDFIWGRLSLEAHSRARVFGREIEMDGDSFIMGFRQEDLRPLIRVACLAVHMAASALARRQQFFGST